VGIMGSYLDSLPDRARDRLIEAQDWCVADVLGRNGARCLVGHAEDWQPFRHRRGWRRIWMDQETGGGGDVRADAAGSLDALCSPSFFAFRRARPADLAVYRERVRRWGLASESRIGARFDRLCGRRGLGETLRIVKARAARGGRLRAPAGERPPSLGSARAHRRGHDAHLGAAPAAPRRM
jgi:hypothetical protein